MPLYIVRDDITRMAVDAVVNAANNSLLGGGGVDGRIHAAAGPELLKECRTLNGCETGEVKVTKGYNLPAKYVLHTVGPIWKNGRVGEKELLISCYRKALFAAKKRECRSIAFPLISAGAYGYPKKEALFIAIETIEEYLQTNDTDVYLTLFDDEAYEIYRNALVIE